MPLPIARTPLLSQLLVAGVLISCFAAPSGAQQQLTAEAVNAAEWKENSGKKSVPSRAVIAKAQILLDRARFSPGEIDAKNGENLEKALRAYAEAQGVPSGKALTKDIWATLTSAATGPAVIEYQITAEDVKGPFLPTVPSKIEEMKDLATIPYANPVEALAEKFHMSQELITALNPGKTFDRQGETIIVANVLSTGPQPKASRVEIDGRAQTIRVFGKDNMLVAFYPATIGSNEKPTPSGTMKVVNVSENPNYTYNPQYAFKGVRSEMPFTINPGPNNPVGLVWIGLSEKSYGIHGTPDPAKVSKTESHGCIRLTNWDAQDLAKQVSKGVAVVFQAETAGDASNPRRNGKKSAKRG
jgi:lipoprotein-anchoring transpeptidase ErfK/SrfK